MVEATAQRARKLATPAEVAEWLQVSTERLRALRRQKRGPRYIQEGRMIRYTWADVHAWALSNRQEPTNG